MPVLRVDLQEGFDGDEVIVRVDGHEVRRDGVTTAEAVGYAGSVEVEVDDGTTANVAVDVPTRGLGARTAAAVAGDVYVGASIAGGDLALVVSAEPMGYL